jgi:hypothetical protein
MSNKNPFEIRSEVLELAKEYMDKQVELNSQYVSKLMETGSVNRQDYLNAFKPYTFEELMAKAHEMYEFVSNGSKK